MFQAKNITSNTRQYPISPRNVTELCENLFRYTYDNNDLESSLIEVSTLILTIHYKKNFHNYIHQVITYECLHIFGDKLIDENDRSKLQEIINSAGRTYLGNKFKGIQNNYYYVPNDHSSDKFMHLNKVSLDEWFMMMQTGINMCGKQVNSSKMFFFISYNKLLH